MEYSNDVTNFYSGSWESRSQEIKDWKEGKPFREWGLNEPYYEDDPLSELGIAWEREIFVSTDWFLDSLAALTSSQVRETMTVARLSSM